MKTATLLLALFCGLLLAPAALNLTNYHPALPVTTETVDEAVQKIEVPKAPDALAVSAVNIKDLTTKVITLEDRNTLVFRGPVTTDSVSKAIRRLREISRSVSAQTPIYLVLDTPGGSIFDGLDLIDFAKSLPQKVNTVTLFAASMGFQIAQNLDTRYIANSGTLMSHRAKVGGMDGQIKGEFESRYKMIRRTVDYLDFVAATRLSMSVKDYDALVLNEYWVHGFDAVSEKAADEQVLVKCGASLDGTETQDFESMFGTVRVTFSKCPLIKAPESIDLAQVKNEEQENVGRVFKKLFEDKTGFVKEFIVEPNYTKFFR